MDLIGFKSLKGLVGETDDVFMQQLVNLTYGLAMEVNSLKRELDNMKFEQPKNENPGK